MAHAVRLNALTDDLVQAVTRLDPNANQQSFKSCRDAASRGLRSQKFPRTNQFNVHSSLDGLVEKFEVLNREDLAKALDQRLKEIRPRQDKWIPELLSLLLCLSDDPIYKAKVEYLDALKDPPPPAQLTWAEIFEDDPLSNDDVWKDIDYADNSEDEVFEQSQALTEETQTSSCSLPNEERVESLDLQSLLVTQDHDVLESLSSQPDNEGSEGYDDRINSELSIIREMLFVARGLPSKILAFPIDQGHKTLHLATTTTETIQSLVADIKRIGSVVLRLTDFASRHFRIAMLQTSANEVLAQITKYRTQIDNIEHGLMKFTGPKIISIIQTHGDIVRCSSNITFLDYITTKLADKVQDTPHFLLDELFEQACSAQAIDDNPKFNVLVGILEACFRTYLRPIQAWMELGTLDGDESHFFIIEDPKASSIPALLWTRRFALRSDFAPEVMAPHLAVILAAGKNVALMQELGIHSNNESIESEPKSRFILPTTISDTPEASLLPFSHTFQHTFSSWLTTFHRSTASILTTNLLYSAPAYLLTTLTALQTLYLATDGSLFTLFSASIFEHIDSGTPNWTNRFTLEDLAASTLGRHEAIDPRLIFAGAADDAATSSRSANRSVRALAGLAFVYRYHWSAANIIPMNTLATYQTVFTLLLQLRRALSILTAPRLRADTSRSSTLHLYLRHRLLHLLSAVHEHLMHNAIGAPCVQLQRQILASAGVDEMISAHENFISVLERRALLTSRSRTAKGAVVALCDLAVVFSDRCAAAGDGDDPDVLAARLAQLRRQFDELRDLTVGDFQNAAREGGDGWEWAEGLAERLAS